MGIALDYTARIAPAALRAAGVDIACRYLSWPYRWAGQTHTYQNPKIVQKAEYDELRAAGFQVVLNWEYDEHDWMGGASAGQAHATEAVRQAKLLGHPAGAPIAGSADFDMTRDQWTSAGRAYAFAYAGTVLAGGYDCPGVYGHCDLLGWCRDEVKLFGFYWQCMSTSFADDRNAHLWPDAHLWQRGRITVGGQQGDHNDIIKEVADVPLTQADADLIWNTKVGGPANSHEAHYALSDLRDQLLAGKSSYDGKTYGAVADLSAKVNELSAKLDQVVTALAGGLSLSDALIAALKAALGNDIVVPAVKQAMREGAGAAAAETA